MKYISLLLLVTVLGLHSLHAAGTYHFNQNYQIHEYIQEGSVTFVFWSTTYDGSVKRKAKCKLVIETLKETDIDGYPNYQLNFITSKDTLILVPESPYYPLVYEKLEKTKRGNKTSYQFAARSNTRYYYPYFIVLNASLIQSVNVKIAKEVTSFSGKSAPTHYGIGREDERARNNYFSLSGSGGEFSSYEEFASTFGIKAAQFSAGFGTEFDATEYAGMESHYNATKRYQDTLLYAAGQKKYNGLVSEFTDGDFIFYKKGTSALDGTPVRLKFQKTSDKTDQITLHEAFTDGQFYDKEKFFFNCPLESDGFVHNRTACSINEYGTDMLMIPLANRIVLIENKNKYVSGVLSPYDNDYLAYDLCFYQRLSLFGTSEKWWCKTNLEEYYIPENDPCLFKNFLTRYLEALK